MGHSGIINLFGGDKGKYQHGKHDGRTERRRLTENVLQIAHGKRSGYAKTAGNTSGGVQRVVHIVIFF